MSFGTGCSSGSARTVSVCPLPLFPDEKVGQELAFRVPNEGWPNLQALLEEIPEEKLHSPDSEDFLNRLEFELTVLEPGRDFQDFYDWFAAIEVQQLELEVR